MSASPEVIAAAQATYEAEGNRDLERLQSDAISYTEWNRRQRDRVNAYYAAVDREGGAK